MDVIVYHNPHCGTSRTVLGLVRNAGVEPHVIDYMKTPPTREMIRSLAARAGAPLSAWLREKEPAFAEFGLGAPDVTDEQRLDAIEQRPALLNRPIVVTPKGVRLCRPAELALDLLPPQRGEFFKENGERVVDGQGRQVATG